MIHWISIILKWTQERISRINLCLNGLSNGLSHHEVSIIWGPRFQPFRTKTPQAWRCHRQQEGDLQLSNGKNDHANKTPTNKTYTPTKTDMGTQNDGFEKVVPFKYGHFWHLCWISRGYCTILHLFWGDIVAFFKKSWFQTIPRKAYETNPHHWS